MLGEPTFAVVLVKSRLVQNTHTPTPLLSRDASPVGLLMGGASTIVPCSRRRSNCRFVVLGWCCSAGVVVANDADSGRAHMYA